MDLDEAQEFRHSSKNLAQAAQIMYEEIISTGMHQDLARDVFLMWWQSQLNPKPDTKMNEITARLLKLLPPEDEDDDDN